MVSKALEKTRTKGRRNRVTIEDKYIGYEPFYEPGTTGEGIEDRQSQWAKGAFYYNYHYKSKDYVPYVLDFAKDMYGYDKDQIKCLKKLKDYELTGYLGKIARLHYRGYEYTAEEFKKFGPYLSDAYTLSLTAIEEEIKEKKDAPPPISIAERTRLKMLDTVFAVWDETIIDEWMSGNFKAEIDIFNEFKSAGLKGNAVAPFKRIIDAEYTLITDAFNKTCDQAVEAYSHIKPANLKKMIKTIDGIYSDLEKLQQSFKAVRGPRIKKRKSTDAQVKNLKYKTEDTEYKERKTLGL